MRFFFGNRNNDGVAAVERPKSVHQIAKEIRQQKVREYEAKITAARAAEANEKNDLLLNIQPDSDKAAPAVVDDATDTNSPGNSDNDDPTINDDEEEDDHTQQETNEDQTQQQPQVDLPGSPLSILSMNTKPVLIHPPRSISRVDDANNDTTTNDDTDNEIDNKNPLGVLCGCI